MLIESQNSLFDSFLDDFFAECDDYLTAIRRNLLAIEAYIDQPQIDRKLLDELFRGFHSLKGLTGMVEVHVAEELAHHLESYLRELRDCQSRLSPAGLDALIQGTNLLEQAIAAYRNQTATPKIESLLVKLKALGIYSDYPPDTCPKATPETTPEISPNPENQLWEFDFTPTADLTERGIHVNSVRERLKSIGTILQAEPRVLPGGGVGFHFLVESTAEAATFALCFPEGITYGHSAADPQGDEVDKHPIPESSVPESNSQITAPAAIATLSSNLVRVDLDKLNDLMRMVGDLVISRSRLEDCLSHVSKEVARSQLRNLQEINSTLERQIRNLREGVMRVRLVPIAEVFARMQFVVRDVAREYQKQVVLELVGQETEIDKFVVERMMEPLLHLVRNAVSHGLETPEERLARGKPATGKMSLRASTDGEMVMIQVEDDGGGIDCDRVAARAQPLGLLKKPIADSDQLLEILCASGFSTREQADFASGRGVGMAVVKNTVAELGGLLQLDTQPGIGTRFTIHLPLTLSIASVLIVSVGNQVFAIPQGALQEVIEVSSGAIVSLETDEILSYRAGVLALVRLSHLFGIPSNPKATTYVLVVKAGLNQVGIVIDRVLAQQEIVVHALTDPLVQTPGVTGATELGNGQGVLILDVAALIRIAQQRKRSRSRLDTPLLKT